MQSDLEIPRLIGLELQKSQCVLEYFAELANLSRAHGSLFARRGEVVVEAFLQVPFKQLHTLLHADLLGAATARLMNRLKLNDLTHANTVG